MDPEALVDRAWSLVQKDRRQALALANQAAGEMPSSLISRVHICRAACCLGTGETGKARELAEAALEETAEHPWRTRALTVLGGAAMRHSDYHQALTHFESSLELMRRHGEELTGPLCNVALIQVELGQYGAALAQLEEALEAARSSGSTLYEANILSNLANAHFYLGTYHVALESYRDAAAIYELEGAEVSRADMLYKIATVYVALGEHAEGLPFVYQAINLLERDGQRADLAFAYSTLGSALHAAGDLDKARDALEKCIAIGKELGARGVVAGALVAVAPVHHEMGDADRAGECIDGALHIAEELGLVRVEAEVRLARGCDAITKGDLIVARSELERAESLAERVSFAAVRLNVQVSLADLCAKEEDWSRALQHFRDYRTLQAERHARDSDQRSRAVQVLHQVTEQRAQVRAAQRERRMEPQRLLAAHEEERRMIARELHDDFSQRLAAIALDLGALGLPRADSALRRLADASRHLHALSRRIHPTILADLGFAGAARAEAERIAAVAGWKLEQRFDEPPAWMASDTLLALYRIIQEALRNAAKHAHAERVSVQFVARNNMAQLQVEDDGVGFDGVATQHGSGLESMHGRARLCGGTFGIHTEPGDGTIVTVHVTEPTNSESRSE